MMAPRFITLFFTLYALCSTAQISIREKFGDFENDQLIKTELVDWEKTSISEKVMSNGKLKSTFEYLEKVAIYSMVYDSDGYMVTGFLIKPKSDSIFPCVIFNRGGNRDYGKLTLGAAMTKLSMIAAEGYVVIASNYRGNAGSEGKEEFGGADVNDVLNLIPALGQIQGADTSRIGMFGVSRGGMMSYQAIKEVCNIKALAVIGGLSDMFMLREKRPKMETDVLMQLVPNYLNSIDQCLEDRSAVRWVDELCNDTKVLILHGENDQRCDVKMARDLHKKMQKHKLDHVFIEYKEDDHGIRNHIDEGLATIINWLDKYVKNETEFDEESDYIFVK